MEGLWIAVVVAVSSFFTTVIAPVLMAIVVSRIQRRNRAEDYARQDRVAERAAETAKLLLESNKEISSKTAAVERQAATAADLLLADNERVAENAKVVNKKLEAIHNLGDTIHTLVNSNMTESIQSELDATVREAAVLKELIALKKGMGHEPTAETVAALKTANGRINELTAILKDRLAATTTAAAKA